MLKPYRFVPIAKKAKLQSRRERNVLNPKLYHGKWQLRMETITPMIVSNGGLTIEYDELINGIIMYNESPVFPGSSLKGTIRSLYEALSYSCVTPPSYRMMRNFGEDDPNQYLPKDNQRLCSGSQICPACQLFGYVNRRDVAKSLLYFGELQLQGESYKWLQRSSIPSQYAPMPRKEALNRYLGEERQWKRKFYTHGKPQQGEVAYLSISEGAVFIGELVYYNLTQEELGTLAYAFGLGNPSFELKIGYGKPAYYGSVRFTLENIIPYQSFGYTSKSYEISDLIEFSKIFQRDDFLKSQAEQIAQILSYELNQANDWGVNAYGKKGY